MLFLRSGTLCDVCIPLGGCLNGGCHEPFECDCDLASDNSIRGKYKGSHCEIRKYSTVQLRSYTSA